MHPLKLSFPVYTLDHRLLLPEGTAITARTLTGMVASNGGPSKKLHLLFGHGTIKPDVRDLIQTSHYNTIFSDTAKTEEVMRALATVQISAQTLESLDHFKHHDNYTYCHMLRVFALATLIAQDTMADTGIRNRFISMGPTHDVGKVSMPLMVLKKKGALTRHERKLIDHHTLEGYILLSYFYGDPRHPACVAARDHHERRDASGTPRGIRLTDGMVEIIIVCDIYDALISPRSYRPVAYDNRTALEEITKIAEAKKIGWKAIRSLVGFNRKARRGQQVIVSLDKRGTPPKENYYGIFED